MIKLVNYAVFGKEFDVAGGDHSPIQKLIEKHQLQGLEVIQYSDLETEKGEREPLPNNMVGMHMRFWPIWLDFWRENKPALLRQFNDEETIQQYYEGMDKKGMVQHYRRALCEAEAMGVEYVVFHACHVELDHCYNYAFTYDDNAVVTDFIELINAVTEGLDITLKLLIENVWWPGFTMCDPDIARKLMTEVHYENKGFMLDTGHLMNSHLDLESEAEAVDFILQVIDNLGKDSRFIQGIHLHSSLSGAYVKEKIKEPIPNQNETSFFERYFGSFGHIGTIDTHRPFKHPSISRVIERVNPLYLVYEFSPESLEMLDCYIEEQNQVL